MFPHELDDRRAFDIAQALLEGFDHHYRLFRAASAQAKRLFEAADWHGQQRLQRERIAYYDLRVAETVERLAGAFSAHELPTEVWSQVKLHYIGLLVEHLQPELAETFFNSVTTRILDRSYFRNSFIFVRPAVSTEYIADDAPGSAPAYRAYYPATDSLHDTLRRSVDNMQLARAFEDLDRDIGWVVEALTARLGDGPRRDNFQLQVVSSLFFRNKGAYLVGTLVNGWNEWPFALPILHAESGRLVIDTVLIGEDDLQLLFSFARAYFMVDIAVPSACVDFLARLMPHKPRAELARFEDGLLAELRRTYAGSLGERRDEVVLHHLYIERRMLPLNLFLQQAAPAALANAVREYGNAIKDMVATNIFPGDMYGRTLA